MIERSICWEAVTILNMKAPNKRALQEAILIKLKGEMSKLQLQLGHFNTSLGDWQNLLTGNQQVYKRSEQQHNQHELIDFYQTVHPTAAE